MTEKKKLNCRICTMKVNEINFNPKQTTKKKKKKKKKKKFAIL